MRVEILEERLRDGDPETGQHHWLVKGDVVNVSDATGARWCMYGWAKDLANAVPTGTRTPGARKRADGSGKKLKVQNAQIGGK